MISVAPGNNETMRAIGWFSQSGRDNGHIARVIGAERCCQLQRWVKTSWMRRFAGPGTKLRAAMNCRESSVPVAIDAR